MKPASKENNSRLWTDSMIQNIGLCSRCVHAIPTAGPRTVFVRCALAGTDARFPRYPVLPVDSCPGFERRPTGDE